MISADESDPVRISDLEHEEEQECLHRIEAAVHEVAHEDVICFGALSSDLEQFHQVEELAMDISTDLTGQSSASALMAYGNRTVNILDVSLVHQNLLRLQTQVLDCRLRYNLASLQLFKLPPLSAGDSAGDGTRIFQHYAPYVHTHLSRSDDPGMMSGAFQAYRLPLVHGTRDDRGIAKDGG